MLNNFVYELLWWPYFLFSFVFPVYIACFQGTWIHIKHPFLNIYIYIHCKLLQISYSYNLYIGPKKYKNDWSKNIRKKATFFLEVRLSWKVGCISISCTCLVCKEIKGRQRLKFYISISYKIQFSSYGCYLYHVIRLKIWDKQSSAPRLMIIYSTTTTNLDN